MSLYEQLDAVPLDDRRIGIERLFADTLAFIDKAGIENLLGVGVVTAVNDKASGGVLTQPGAAGRLAALAMGLTDFLPQLIQDVELMKYLEVAPENRREDIIKVAAFLALCPIVGELLNEEFSVLSTVAQDLNPEDLEPHS